MTALLATIPVSEPATLGGQKQLDQTAAQVKPYVNEFTPPESMTVSDDRGGGGGSGALLTRTTTSPPAFSSITPIKVDSQISPNNHVQTVGSGVVTPHLTVNTVTSSTTPAGLYQSQTYLPPLSMTSSTTPAPITINQHQQHQNALVMQTAHLHQVLQHNLLEQQREQEHLAMQQQVYQQQQQQQQQYLQHQQQQQQTTYMYQPQPSPLQPPPNGMMSNPTYYPPTGYPTQRMGGPYPQMYLNAPPQLPSQPTGYPGYYAAPPPHLMYGNNVHPLQPQQMQLQHPGYPPQQLPHPIMPPTMYAPPPPMYMQHPMAVPPPPAPPAWSTSATMSTSISSPSMFNMAPPPQQQLPPSLPMQQQTNSPPSGRVGFQSVARPPTNQVKQLPSKSMSVQVKPAPTNDTFNHLLEAVTGDHEREGGIKTSDTTRKRKVETAIKQENTQQKKSRSTPPTIVKQSTVKTEEESDSDSMAEETIEEKKRQQQEDSHGSDHDDHADGDSSGDDDEAPPTHSSLLQRSELACGSIRVMGTKVIRFRSIIRCGALDRHGQTQLMMHLPYFQREMDVYTAETDHKQRPLVRASTLADKFNCATNKIGMYLARRRSVMDGIFQATEFTHKPTGKTGLKVGGYFLTLEACLDFERHYWEHRDKKDGGQKEAPRHRNRISMKMRQELAAAAAAAAAANANSNNGGNATQTAGTNHATNVTTSKKSESGLAQSSKPQPTQTNTSVNKVVDDELTSDDDEDGRASGHGENEDMPELRPPTSKNNTDHVDTNAPVAPSASDLEDDSRPSTPEEASPLNASLSSFTKETKGPQSSAELELLSTIGATKSDTLNMARLAEDVSKSALPLTMGFVTQPPVGVCSQNVQINRGAAGPPSPPSTAVSNSLALIRQSLDADAERKRAVLGHLHSSPVALSVKAKPSSPVFSFLRPANSTPSSLGSHSTNSSTTSSPAGSKLWSNVNTTNKEVTSVQ